MTRRTGGYTRRKRSSFAHRTRYERYRVSRVEAVGDARERVYSDTSSRVLTFSSVARNSRSLYRRTNGSVIDIFHTTEVVGFLALGVGRSDPNGGNVPT